MAVPEQEPKTPAVSSEANVPATTRDRVVSKRAADVTLELVEKYGDSFEPLTEATERRLRWKLYLNVIGLTVLINLWLFVSRSHPTTLHLRCMLILLPGIDRQGHPGLRLTPGYL